MTRQEQSQEATPKITGRMTRSCKSHDATRKRCDIPLLPHLVWEDEGGGSGMSAELYGLAVIGPHGARPEMEQRPGAHHVWPNAWTASGRA
jgi:hypothetical protein